MILALPLLKAATMNIGVYQSAASLAALERWQDAVTQNISSSQVIGFKRRTAQIDGRPGGELITDSTSRSGESRPAVFPQVRFGVAFGAGEAQPTRRELDLAISGEGFFTVRMENGEVAYTRSGQLRVQADRSLVTSQGLPVLDDSGNPMQLTAQGGPILVETNGIMRQGETALGRIAVVDFPDTSVLRPVAGGLYRADDGTEPVTVENPNVLQGHLEASNIKPLHEMVDLVNIARAYEANQKIIQNRDQMLQRTLEALT
ncbi:MAG TPA: flagellar hook-basal body protein [Candidatus Synoicihabitans sp.]|nr:flagellar hook-basal body protein [Candidatus Synoicihabitans sp.]